MKIEIEKGQEERERNRRRTEEERAQHNKQLVSLHQYLFISLTSSLLSPSAVAGT